MPKQTYYGCKHQPGSQKKKKKSYYLVDKCQSISNQTSPISQKTNQLVDKP